MDVTSTTSTSPATAAARASMAGAGTPDFHMFLTMLTTQLKNQDPTSPMESTDFAVQLATFSGVEQQTATNQTLESIAAKLDAMTLSDLSSWLGAKALVEAPVVVNGSAVTLYPQTEESADSAVLVVRNESGDTVVRTDIDPKKDSVTWTPADATGAALTSGSYSLTVESYSGETLLSTNPVQHYAKVVEARNGSDGTVLVLEDGTEIAASDVISLTR